MEANEQSKRTVVPGQRESVSVIHEARGVRVEAPCDRVLCGYLA